MDNMLDRSSGTCQVYISMARIGAMLENNGIFAIVTL